LVTLENSPSKVAAADQPSSHFISAEAVTSAASCACAAPQVSVRQTTRRDRLLN
jgi:hypothetical protein